tara:strand:- start:558 stop:1124 length:567 start_codon:yes stop_codon:yes gene_type:complete
MITRKEIIFAMSFNDIPFITLYNRVNKYKRMIGWYVQSIVREGCRDPEDALIIAYVLGLTKHLPKNFIPTQLNITPVKRIANIQKAPPPKKQTFDEKIDNRKVIINMIKQLGTLTYIAKQVGCNIATISLWKAERPDGNVYIAPRFIPPLLKLCEQEGIPIIEEDLIKMLPKNKLTSYKNNNQYLVGK